jgi:hypothetical protein
MGSWLYAPACQNTEAALHEDLKSEWALGGDVCVVFYTVLWATEMDSYRGQQNCDLWNHSCNCGSPSASSGGMRSWLYSFVSIMFSCTWIFVVCRASTFVHTVLLHIFANAYFVIKTAVPSILMHYAWHPWRWLRYCVKCSCQVIKWCHFSTWAYKVSEMSVFALF